MFKSVLVYFTVMENSSESQASVGPENEDDNLIPLSQRRSEPAEPRVPVTQSQSYLNCSHISIISQNQATYTEHLDRLSRLESEQASIDAKNEELQAQIDKMRKIHNYNENVFREYSLDRNQSIAQYVLRSSIFVYVNITTHFFCIDLLM